MKIIPWWGLGLSQNPFVPSLVLLHILAGPKSFTWVHIGYLRVNYIWSRLLQTQYTHLHLRGSLPLGISVPRTTLSSYGNLRFLHHFIRNIVSSDLNNFMLGGIILLWTPHCLALYLCKATYWDHPQVPRNYEQDHNPSIDLGTQPYSKAPSFPWPISCLYSWLCRSSSFIYFLFVFSYYLTPW